MKKTEVNQQTEQNTAKPEPLIYITELNPLVIAAYRREFPGRKIILLPPDDVAKGIVIDDEMPNASQKAA